MANVNGTILNDFIHRLGDGLTAPAGYVDVTGVTTGDDSVNGSLGNDIIYGDAGNDTLNGGSGSDTLVGGVGNDTYIVDSTTGDTVVEAAGGGIDTVQSSVSFTLGAELERLTLTGSSDINGTGNGLANVITGNTGDNSLDGAGGDDTLDGGVGTDDLYGAAGDDTLDGNTNSDTMFGGAGNDTLIGGTSGDTMYGGADNDVYVVDSTGDSVFESASGGTDTVQSSVSFTLGSEVERLILTGSDAINGTGNSGANVITGNSGANTLDGAAGNDTLEGGSGADRLVGGTGDDTMTGGADGDVYVVDSAGDVVVEVGGGGTDTVQSAIDYALGAEVEHLTLTGTSGIDGTGNTLANIIVGNTGANLLDGGDGDDSLDGSSGIDTLFGGNGNDLLTGGTSSDTMSGGAGNDTFVVDSAGETVIEGVGGGIDTVQSSVSYTIGAEVEHLTLTGTSSISGVGNALANIITGNSGNNQLVGGLGLDTVNGGSGNDTLRVNDASEVVAGESYIGGSGDDTLVGNDVAAPVSLSGVSLSGLESINGFFDGLTLTAAQLDAFTGFVNTGAITLSGAGSVNLTDADVFTGEFQLSNAGNALVLGDDDAAVYVVNGGNSADTITTDASNDQITGGLGADTINAGAGNDTLYVNTASDVVAGEVYNGSTGTADRLEASTVDGAVNLANVTLSGLESIVGFFDGVTMTAAQLDAFNGIVNTGPITLSGSGSANIADADVFTGVFQLSNAGNGLTLGDGGAAFHVVNGGNAADTITTGSGNDQITGGLGADTINAGAGNDTLFINTASEVVAGEVYNGGTGTADRLEANTVDGPVNLSGSTVTGLEILNGFFDGVTLTAAQLDGFTGFVNTGAITISGAGSADISDADVFTSTFQLSNAGNGLVLGDGGAAFHVVYGGTAADTVTTGSGDDQITGGLGVDTINAGAGNDTLFVNTASQAVAGEVYNGGAGAGDRLEANTVDGAVNLSGATLSGLEIINGFFDGLTLTAAQLDGFTGFVNTGIITLSGAGSADISDADVFTGEFQLSNAGNGLVLGDGGAAFHVVNGGSGADTITTGSGNDQITGGLGADTVNGGAGDDTLFVNTDAEAVAGEVYDGGAGDSDRLEANTVDGPVDLSSSTVTGLELLNGFFDGLTLTAAQLDGFTSLINTGAITLSGAGTADISDAAVSTGVFQLSNAGNGLVLGGATSYAVNGGSGADTITTGSGDDQITGGLGADTVDGGAGNDTLFVNTDTEAVAGEVYDGGAGAGDRLEGATVHGPVDLSGSTVTGLEFLNGFFDGLTLTAAQLDGFSELVNTGAITLAGGGSADISDADVVTSTFQLSNAGNALTLGDGGAALHVVNGGSGADTITTVSSDDQITGGLGADTISAGAGNDTLFINTDAEAVTGEVYDGGAGIGDRLEGANVHGAADLSGSTVTGLELLNGFFDGLTLTAAQLDGFTSFIETGAITLSGGGSADISDADVVTSTFQLSNAGNALTIGDGGAALHVVNGGSGADTITTGSSNDQITGGLGADTINAGAGNDTLFVNTDTEAVAGEVYDGGAGTGDRLEAATVHGPVDLSGSTVTGLELLNGFFDGLTLTAAQLDGFTSFIETGAITLSGAGSVDISDADVVTSTFQLSNAGNALTLGDGGAALHVVNGGSGADTITTGSSNDQITGGLGADTISAGAGDDTLFVNTDTEAVAGEVYDGGAGTGDRLEGATIHGPVDLSGSTVTGLENINGFFDGLTLTAAQLDGFTGLVNTGIVTLSGAGSADISDATVFTGAFQLSNAGNGLTLGDGGAAFHVVNGGTSADTITTGSGDDQITGGLGADTITAGAGNDTLFVNTASQAVAGEVYDGGAGTGDRLEANTVDGAVNLSGVTLAGLESINGFFDGVTLTAAQLDAFTGLVNTGAITLSGAGNVDLSDADVFTGAFQLSNAGNGLVLADGAAPFYIVNGGSGADTVTTAGGADTVFGGLGADTIFAGAGNDTLSGGDGADWFGYTASGSGIDTIADFSGQTDFGGGAGDGDDLVFDDILTGTFEYRGDQAFTGTGNTEARVAGNQVFIDGDGDGGADIIIALNGLNDADQLVAGDFAFI